MVAPVPWVVTWMAWPAVSKPPTITFTGFVLDELPVIVIVPVPEVTNSRAALEVSTVEPLADVRFTTPFASSPVERTVRLLFAARVMVLPTNAPLVVASVVMLLFASSTMCAVAL
jgi:hypothetical protein